MDKLETTISKSSFEGRENIGVIMSNYDHEIDERASELNNVNMGEYSAWDFFAYVIKANGKFYARISRYRTVIDIIEAPTLEDLMNECSSKYGYD